MACAPLTSVPLLGCCGGVACHVSVDIRYVQDRSEWDAAAYAAIVAELESTAFPESIPSLPEGSVTSKFIRDDFRTGRTSAVVGGNSCLRSVWQSIHSARSGTPNGIRVIQVVKARFCNRGRWCSYSTWGPSETVQPNFIICENGSGEVVRLSPDLGALAPESATLQQDKQMVTQLQMLFQDSTLVFERRFSCDNAAIKPCCNQAP